MKTWTTVILGIVFLVGFGAAPSLAEPAVTLDALLASSDLVLSEAAREGVAVELVMNPGEVLGAAPPRNFRQYLRSQGITIRELRQQNPGNWRELLKALRDEWRAIRNGGGGGGGGSLITNPEFTTDVSGWTAINAYGGATSFGSIVPDAASVDGSFAVAHTGVWTDAAYGMLEQTFNVSSSTTANFAVLYNFVTTEWGSTSGAQFNDAATVTLTNASGAVQFRLIESALGSQLFAATDLPTIMNGGRGQTGGQTGWVVGSSGPLVFAPGVYTIRIDVGDAADAALDSAILVDRVGLQ
jgi:hypothetical protein